MLKLTKINEFKPIYIEIKEVVDKAEEYEQTIVENPNVDKVIVSMMKLNLTINGISKGLYYVGVNRMNEAGDVLQILDYGGISPIKEVAELMYNKTIEEVKKDIIK